MQQQTPQVGWWVGVRVFEGGGVTSLMCMLVIIATSVPGLMFDSFSLSFWLGDERHAITTTWLGVGMTATGSCSRQWGSGCFLLSL